MTASTSPPGPCSAYGIASYRAGGKTYLVTANEGDAREVLTEDAEGNEIVTFAEEVRVRGGLERIGGVMVYDVTDPSAPSFESYANFRDFTVDVCLRDAECVASNPAAGDLGPEGLEFVPAAASPSGQPLLLVGNEISGTTTIWQGNAD